MKVAAGIRGSLNPAIDSVLNFDLQEIKVRQFQGMAAQAMGEIYLYIDDKHMDEAEAWIRKAIEVDERTGCPGIWRGIMPSTPNSSKRKAIRPRPKKNWEGHRTDAGCDADGWVKRYEERGGRVVIDRDSSY